MDLMDTLVSLCKRRGFIFQSSEIYGGLNSCWDYGPLGVELKNNLKRHWWRTMTQLRDDVVGIDASILMHPSVWVASGHVEAFTDPLVDCRSCKQRFRGDELKDGKCPRCGSRQVTEARQFNLMFKTHMGPVEEEGSVVYLRPETAQGIYVNFQNVLTPSRQKIPFGIAQIGKAFRNEISPGNFVFRTREFEQMEMQFFVEPGTDAEWLERWKAARMDWYAELGLRKEKLRLHQHPQKELAHYAKDAYDIEYEFPFGWKELEGIHNRTDYDLSRHQEHSGKDLSYFDAASNKRFIPYIIETSAGVDRTLLTCLVDAYREEEVRGEKRVVLKLHPQIAPMKAGIFPLVRRDGLPEIAAAIARELRRHMPVFVDDTGSIGRRYRRQDEAGTPFGITVDSQTQQDGTVTVRDRDTMAQERVRDTELAQFLRARIG
ncbi:MAG: glycine--tRNA ligase [Chlamydiae bacterium]|jgi:glycyl-tRNA synthetase|nr:glycine--tRNA ligase [Chlamydiota bacterium]